MEYYTFMRGFNELSLPGPVAQFADLGVVSLIPTGSHTFMETDHEIFCTVILLWLGVSYKRKYVHKVLVNNGLVKLPRKKVWLGQLTIST